MRLIDADSLLEKMKKTNRYFDVKFDIEEQPTAYDVDAVVAELEEKARQTWLVLAERNGYERAIDIVKRGGVE